MRRFRAEAEEAFLALPLEEFRVVYHRPSGQTHILASPATEIFDALCEGEADAQTLRARLAAQFDLMEGGAEAVSIHCDALTALGLARVIV